MICCFISEGISVSHIAMALEIDLRWVDKDNKFPSLKDIDKTNGILQPIINFMVPETLQFKIIYLMNGM